MRRFYSIITSLTIVSSAIVTPGCARIEADIQSDGPVTVAFSTKPSGTRAALEPAAGLFAWEIGDRVAVWADNQEGNPVLEAKEFTLLSRAN